MGISNQSYSESFKDNILQKVFQPNAPTVSSIARAANMPPNTLYQWVSKLRAQSGTPIMKNKISGELKLQAIINLSSMAEGDLGQYLREKGLYKSQVEEWKKETEDLISSKKSNSQKTIDANNKIKDHEIKQLKKELRRKEKALAEASALLILKKKANLIWGEEED